MEQEATNTLLGIFNLPTWLEAGLAVCSVGFLLLLSWRKSKIQNMALEELAESSRALTAMCRETIITQRNLHLAIMERLESDSCMNGKTADIYIDSVIDAICFQVANFGIELKGDKPDNLVQSFCMDSFIAFASALSRVQHTNGKRLGDFAQIMRWHFEEKLPDQIKYHTDPYQPSLWLRNQLKKEWERWK